MRHRHYDVYERDGSCCCGSSEGGKGPGVVMWFPCILGIIGVLALLGQGGVL